MRFSHATTKTRRSRVVSQPPTSAVRRSPPLDESNTTTQASSNQQVRCLSVPDDLPGLAADIEAVLSSKETSSRQPPRLPRASSLANVSSYYSYSPDDADDQEEAEDWLWLDDHETQRSLSSSVTRVSCNTTTNRNAPNMMPHEPRSNLSSSHSLDTQDWLEGEDLDANDFLLWKRTPTTASMDNAGGNNTSIVSSPMVLYYPSIPPSHPPSSSSANTAPLQPSSWSQVSRSDLSSSSSITTTVIRTERSASNHLPESDDMTVAIACLNELSFIVSEERHTAAIGKAATLSSDAAVSKTTSSAAAVGLCQASPSSVFDLHTIEPSPSGRSPTRPPASHWMSSGDDDVRRHAHDRHVQDGCNSKCYQFPLPCVHRHHHCGGRACPEDETAAILFQKHLNRANSLPPARTKSFAPASIPSSASALSPSLSSLMIRDTPSSSYLSSRTPQLPRKPSLKRVSSLQSSENHNGIHNNSSSNKLKRNVSFSKLEIREYNVELSDHPGCSFGPPIQLGWKVCDETTMSVEDYEQMRVHQHRPRRSGTDLTLSYNVRRYLLLKRAGYSNAELKQAMKEVNRIKRERLVTDMLLPASFLDETLEDWMQKVKQFFQVP